MNLCKRTKKLNVKEMAKKISYKTKIELENGLLKFIEEPKKQDLNTEKYK